MAVQSLVAAAMQSVGRGEWDRAQAALERALKLSPNDSSLWTQLAFTHYRKGTLKQAAELAQRALSLVSARPGEQAAAWRLIADIETAQGNSVQAASARRKAESLAK
ncbi:MAG: tetratricopeptide repeat protein [Gammaproteobacteria bacterium]|nr:tetratricopeptide repeat protein [Gammaproteobacteria bacterium]